MKERARYHDNSAPDHPKRLAIFTPACAEQGQAGNNDGGLFHVDLFATKCVFEVSGTIP